MLVTCEACGLEYDDVYRLTYCPHERFEMRCVVGGPDGVVGVATSLEEFGQLMKQARSDRMGGE